MTKLLITSRSLQDRQRSLVWWAVGLLVYTAMIIAVWPTLEDNTDIQALADDYPEGFKAMFGGTDAFALLTTPAGFLNTYVFSMIFPLFLVGLGVAMGSALLAGDEENGLLDLLLSTPVARARAVGEKALAIALATIGMAIIMVVVVLGLGSLVGLDIGAGALTAATIGALLFGLLHGWIALLAGAVKGSKGFAAGVAWGVALAGYLMNVMANLSDSLDWLRWASPLYWATANDPIVNGIPFEYLLLTGACVATLVATIMLFDRHDLS